jgi:folate-binding protein YgfZ
VGFAADEVFRIEAGRARFGVDYTTESFPGEAGLDDALTYAKCYVGQEVVARMRTYGHANRALRGLEFAARGDSDLPDRLRGAPVTVEGREVGRVTSCVDSPRHGMIGLAILHRSGWTPGTRVSVGAGASEAIVRELPFARR